MQERRLEEYKKILSVNPNCLRAVENCIGRHGEIYEKEYLTVWAPALLEYVNWVVQRAKQEGIRRLYFLARDAYPMYEIAKHIAESQTIECRYLKVSRYALRIPEYHLLGEKCLDRIFLSGIDVSLGKILRRAALDDDEVWRVCEEINYTGNTEAVLNRREILKLKEEVRTKSRLVFEYIYRHSKAAYADCIGYLKGEGLLDNVPWAVVDSGWVGTIQKSLQNILATEEKGIQVRGYYFGLYELPEDQTGCVYESYYFGPIGKLGKKMNFSNCLYEMIYTHAGPMVKGYEKRENAYLPVYSDLPNPNCVKVEKNTELLIEFIEEYLACEKGELSRFKPVAYSLYRRVMGNPTSWEAHYYGNYMFSDDICDEQNQSAARKLTAEEIKDLGTFRKLLVMAGISNKVIHESAWIEGSIVNSGQNRKISLRRAKRAKYLTHLRQSIKALKNK